MRKSFKKIGIIFSLLLIGFYIAFPLIWTFYSSIRQEKDIYSRELSFDFSSLSFKRYGEILTGRVTSKTQPASGTVGGASSDIMRSFLNSLIVGAGVTILCLFVGALAAYAFAKLKSRGRNGIFFIIVFLRFLPVLVLALPFFVIFQRLNLIDSKVALIISYTSLTLPLVIWIMKAFFETVPDELLDAARIDGCSSVKMIFRIFLPVSVPAFVTAGLIAFVNSWQEFLFALVLTMSNNSKTLPVAMAEFFGREGFNYGMASAGSILAIIPVVIIAFVAQRYIIRGLMAGTTVG